MWGEHITTCHGLSIGGPNQQFFGGKFLHSWNKKIWKFLFLQCKFEKQIVKKLESFENLLKPQNCQKEKTLIRTLGKPSKWNITSSSPNNTFIY
jgi:hypothetical protein